MNDLRIPFGFLSACIVAVACGGSGESAGDMDMGQASADIELGGQFELAAADPWSATVEAAELTCQRSTMGTPFRAQWRDPAGGFGVLVTGLPQEGMGNEHRVDNFQVVRADSRDARLSDAKLSVEELSQSGAVSYYAVEASGTFAEGGTFTASGRCRA